MSKPSKDCWLILDEITLK